MTVIEVILPCLDEAEALPWVLRRLPAGYRPLVVDNGSTDGSVEVARSLGAAVIEAGVRGYGAACHAGLLGAGAAVVVMMDCDGTVDPAELPALVAPVLAGQSDLVVARRSAVDPGAFPWRLRLANAVLARALRRRTGVAMTDCGPVRVARRTALLALNVTDRRSGYPVETIVRAAAAGWRVEQVAIGYRYRRGRSKVTGTPLGAARAVQDSLAVIASTAGRHG